MQPISLAHLLLMFRVIGVEEGSVAMQ